MAKKSSSKPSAVLGYNDKRVKSQRKKDRSFKVRSVFGIVTLSLAAIALVALVAFSFADQQYKPEIQATMRITNENGTTQVVPIGASPVVQRRQPTLTFKFGDISMAGKAGVSYECKDNMIASPTATGWFKCTDTYTQGFATGKVVDYHINVPGTEFAKGTKNTFEFRTLVNGTAVAGSAKKYEWVYAPNTHEVMAKVDGKNLIHDLRVVLPSASQVRVAWDDADGATTFKCSIRTLQEVGFELKEVAQTAQVPCVSTQILNLPAAAGLYDVRVQAFNVPPSSIAGSSNLPEKYGRSGNTYTLRKVRKYSTSTYFADQDISKNILPAVDLNTVSFPGIANKTYVNGLGVSNTDYFFTNNKVLITFKGVTSTAPVKYVCQLWDNEHGIAVYGTSDCLPSGTTLTLPAAEKNVTGQAKYRVRIITYSTQAGFTENSVVTRNFDIIGNAVKAPQML